MTISEKIYAYLREARVRDRSTRVSDFQMRAEKDAIILTNLKTRNIQVFPAEEKDNDWY